MSMWRWIGGFIRNKDQKTENNAESRSSNALNGTPIIVAMVACALDTDVS
jgi:hypothetical protein